VIAQTLEYAAWVDNQTLQQLDEIAREYATAHGLDASNLADLYRLRFAEAPAGSLGSTVVENLTFNARQRMVVVAESFTTEAEETLRYLRTRLGVDITGLRFTVHKAGSEVLIVTDIVVGRELQAVASEKSATRQPHMTDDEIAEYVDTDFLRESVHAIEEWVSSLGRNDLEVRHLAGGSSHTISLAGSQLLYYYFAKKWI
jgi:hypothetical protein